MYNLSTCTHLSISAKTYHITTRFREWRERELARKSKSNQLAADSCVANILWSNIKSCPNLSTNKDNKVCQVKSIHFKIKLLNL